jgi:hypothetical protein
MQANAAAEAGADQDKQARNNALLGGYQKADAQQRAAYEASALRARNRAIMAAGLAATAANGVETTQGSPANIFASNAANSEADAARINANAARAAWGYGFEQQNSLAAGANARRAGILGGVGAGLSGLGQAVSIAGSTNWGG